MNHCAASSSLDALPAYKRVSVPPTFVQRGKLGYRHFFSLSLSLKLRLERVEKSVAASNHNALPQLGPDSVPFIVVHRGNQAAVTILQELPLERVEQEAATLDAQLPHGRDSPHPTIIQRKDQANVILLLELPLEGVEHCATAPCRDVPPPHGRHYSFCYMSLDL